MKVQKLSSTVTPSLRRQSMDRVRVRSDRPHVRSQSPHAAHSPTIHSYSQADQLSQTRASSVGTPPSEEDDDGEDGALFSASSVPSLSLRSQYLLSTTSPSERTQATSRLRRCKLIPQAGSQGDHVDHSCGTTAKLHAAKS
eukprot:scaffold3187_cov361-Prasinococcus_capsulatus_cf.AAC.5